MTLVRRLLADERVQRAKPSTEQLAMVEHIGETLAVELQRRRAARRSGASRRQIRRQARRRTRGNMTMERKHEKYQRLLDFCKALPPTPTAVAHPCDESSLRGAVDAAQARPDRADPGRAARAHRGGREAARHRHRRTADRRRAHSQASAAKAVELVREGKAEALMKGSLHTDELMGAVVKRDTGLRTARRISHCFVMDVPAYAGDADHHRRRGQHRADAGGQGRHRPERDRPRARAAASPEVRVAILSAMETVNPKVPSTIEAARAVQDGRPRPDHRRASSTARWRSTTRSASSRRRSRRSTRRSPAAPTCWSCPDLEAGNMLAKSLSFLAGADAAGIVLGARVPIILTSRADSRDDAARLLRDRGAGRAARGARRPPRPWREPAIVTTDMADAIAVLNAGSSSIKFSLFADARRTSSTLVARGQVEGLYTSPRFVAKDGARRRHRREVVGRGRQARPRRRARAPGRVPARARSPGTGWSASATASCTAGSSTRSRCASTPTSSRRSRSYVPLAPLHQPHNLAPIRLLLERRPRAAAGRVLRHRVPPRRSRRSRRRSRCRKAITDRGVRRYGFHGLSYEYIAQVLPQYDARAAAGKTVVLHLGNGASMCAIAGGRSVASTMGFTAVDGLPMGTRCGNLDPGVCST